MTKTEAKELADESHENWDLAKEHLDTILSNIESLAKKGHYTLTVYVQYPVIMDALSGLGYSVKVLGDSAIDPGCTIVEISWR